MLESGHPSIPPGVPVVSLRWSSRRPGGNPLWAVYVSGAFGLSTSAMLGLLVPLRANQLGLDLGAIGLVVGAHSAGAAVLTLPLSSLISRLGIRTAFIFSAGGCAVLAAAFTTAVSFWSLILLNAGVGAVSSLGWVASQACVSNSDDLVDRARNTGRFSFFTNVSQMATPLMVGASATLVSYQATFLVIATYCLLFAFVGAALPAAGQPSVRGSAGAKAVALLFRVPRLQVALLLTFVRIWVPAAWRPFLPLLLVVGDVSPHLAGAVLSFAAAVATGVSLLTGKLSRFSTPEALCTVALGTAAAGLFLSPHLLNWPIILLPAAMVGIGNGLSLPLLIVLVGEAAPHGQRGLALATRNAVNYVAATIAPLGTAPVIAAVGATAGFSIAAGFAGLVLSAATALQRRSAGPPL
jgi:predicted MFS family arabinose efflux permease